MAQWLNISTSSPSTVTHQPTCLTQALSAATWSPWEPSPIFLQQSLSLTSPQLITKYLPSIDTTRIISPPTHRRLATRPRSENDDYLGLERSPIRAKSRIHKSMKSLIDQPSKIESDLIDDLKHFSSSFNCLDATKFWS